MFWHANDFEHTLNSFLQQTHSGISLEIGNASVQYPTFQLYHLANQENNEPSVVLNAVNSGCQAYIISSDVAVDFVTIFYDKMDKFDLRFVPNYMTFVPLDNTKFSYYADILNHPIANGNNLNLY